MEKPGKRINGIDEFMVQQEAQKILKDMEKNGWTQGEAELLPRCIISAIKGNSERLEKIKPFTVCEITQETL